MSHDGAMADNGSVTARRELGDFLRSRRERLAQEQVGLVPTGRRRTPGLRREEVAVVAGVGLTWYAWLEQGRSINVSTQVVTSIGRALRLTTEETQHLLHLAGVRSAAPATATCDPELLAAFQPVLDKFDPYPASLQTPLFNVVAYNDSYRHLFADLDEIPAEDRNCAVKFFTDSDWRDRYVDADLVAERMVARMRAAAVTGNSGPEPPQVVDWLLRHSDEFARLWKRHDVLMQDHEVKRLISPLVGRLDLSFVTTQVAETGHRMTVMTPNNDDTSARLDKLSTLTTTEPADNRGPCGHVTEEQ